MVKGDDAIRRTKTKANRKKVQKESSSVSSRVAAMIASKKRRKSGKRRMCQGMCFSLPTPEDPFNERQGKLDAGRKAGRKKTEDRKETKKLRPSKFIQGVSKNDCGPVQRTMDSEEINVDAREHKRKKVESLEIEPLLLETSGKTDGKTDSLEIVKEKFHLTGKCEAAHEQPGRAFDYQGCPSKFLMLCLNTLRDELMHFGFFNEEEGQSLFYNSWGIEFWKCYSDGRNILETSGACSAAEQIAWIASTAADAIARKEIEGVQVANPFLLFLVPSQEKASLIRSVCKPLKDRGIYTVSVHPGVSLLHQIRGLRSCEPEFIVSTPDRLLELVSLKAIDISEVSILVIDGIESSYQGDYLNNVKTIRQYISGVCRSLVFSGCVGSESASSLRTLLPHPVCRLSFEDSIAGRGAFIMQSMHVCASEEEMRAKALQILDQTCGDQLGPSPSKLMYIVGDQSNVDQLTSAIESKGFTISRETVCGGPEVENSKLRPTIFVVELEDAMDAELSEFETIVIYDFVLEKDDYVEILETMARYTISGELHTLLAREEAKLAAPLVEVLQLCGQTVPEALELLLAMAPSL